MSPLIVAIPVCYKVIVTDFYCQKNYTNVIKNNTVYTLHL